MTQKALLPNFEEDIFINYCHRDNQALISDSDFKGWVDTMHESLKRRLTMLIGETPKIWRDTLITGTDVFPETIVIRLSKTAFLVSVLSPSYVTSEWCQKELNEFYERAAENGGIKINNKSRIFKVVKTPIGDNDPRIDPLAKSGLPQDLRTLLQESLGYKFFEIDDQGKLREFWPELSKEYQKKFLERLEDLAQDIKDFIKFQQEAGSNIKNNIYLAETTPELADDRNQIKRALQQHDYRVLPDENLPFEDQAFTEKVSCYLQESSLSIHLIGSDHTNIKAEEKSVQLQLNLQHQLAAERIRKQHELAMSRGENDPNFSRLIWIPTPVTPRESSYQEFIAYLENDPAVYENAEVLCNSLEDLKTILQKKLKFNREESIGNKKRVYLIFDKQDRDVAAPLQNFLQRQNYDVLLSFKENAQVRHTENLKTCDAVLVVYGSQSRMDIKLTELRKFEVARGDKPFLAKGIYVAGPETADKQTFTTEEALVMKGFGEFAPESLRPFLEKVGITASVAA